MRTGHAVELGPTASARSKAQAATRMGEIRFLMKSQHQQTRGAPECDASDDSVLQCEPYWYPSDGCCKRRITPEANHPSDDSVVVGAGLE